MFSACIIGEVFFGDNVLIRTLILPFVFAAGVYFERERQERLIEVAMNGILAFMSRGGQIDGYSIRKIES